MMIFVPLFYFFLLLVVHYKKNGNNFDIACYILSIFSVSSFFSILYDTFKLRSNDSINYVISAEATFVYCVLITIGVLPFMLYPHTKMARMSPCKNPEILKFFAWVFFLWMFIYTIMSFDSLVKILTGNLGQMRMDHYNGLGESKWFANYPFILRVPINLFLLSTGSAWILLFFGFYCISVQKLPFKYGLLYILASIVGIVRNVVSAGRSDMVYWLIGLGACCVFYYPYFSKKQWKSVKKYMYVLVGLFISYIFVATVSRFGEREMGTIGGSEGGFITYAGQSFVNFCFFWDTYTCPIPTLELIFPFTYSALGISTEGGAVGMQHMLSLVSGYNLGVFYTYIGQIAVASHNVVAVIYCIFHSLISLYCGSRLKKNGTRLIVCYFYLVLASVLFLGLFSHYYCFQAKTFSVFSFAMIILTLSSSGKTQRKSYK